jgi:hypothetical protein
VELSQPKEAIMAEDTEGALEFVYVIDGDRAPRTRRVAPGAILKELLEAVAQEHQREDLLALYREDQELALALELAAVEVLAGEFQVFHLGRQEKVAVDVAYNGRIVHERFAPSTTVRKVIAWAISPQALNLQGDVSDFQLKHNGELLPLELHIGQLAHHHEAVRLTLVFKVKPQG